MPMEPLEQWAWLGRQSDPACTCCWQHRQPVTKAEVLHADFGDSHVSWTQNHSLSAFVSCSGWAAAAAGSTRRMGTLLAAKAETRLEVSSTGQQQCFLLLSTSISCQEQQQVEREASQAVLLAEQAALSLQQSG